MGKGIKRYYSIIIAAVVSLISFTLTTCNPTESICPEPKPPGYQEDIPWPSLADSPWPMNHADPQSTGRSKYVGPQSGIIIDTIDSLWIQTGIAIGSDSSFYFVTSSLSNQKAYLYSADFDGSINWKFDLSPNEINTTPLVNSRGKIFVATYQDKTLFCINPDGTLFWKKVFDDRFQITGMNLDLQGNLYICGNKQLYCINPASDIVWSFSIPPKSMGIGVTITFAPDGKTLYISGHSPPSLLAVDVIQKSIKWQWGEHDQFASPLIDDEGNIYLYFNRDSLGTHKQLLYCLTPDKNIKWRYELPNVWGNVYADPTMDKEGNLYVAFDTLYSFNYSGELRWKRAIGYTWSPLICDRAGNIYVLTIREFFNSIKCFDKDGSLKWDLPIDEGLRSYPGYSPAIASSGELIVTCWSFALKSIYIIK
jgi:outer membrane protein assembly factor BamB